MTIPSNAPKRDLVRISGQVVSRTLRENDPQRWQALLASVYRDSEDRPHCLCRGGKDPLPMSVARHGGGLLLKRMPGDGPRHHQACESFGVEVACENHEQDAAIRRATGGGYDINLAVPLSLGGSDATGGTTAGRIDTQETRRSLPLLGLLHFLWERSGLNRWAPPRDGERPERGLGTVYTALAQELSEVTIKGLQGDQVCFVPVGGGISQDQLEERRKALQASFSRDQGSTAPNDRPITIVVGEIRQVFDGKYGTGIRLKWMPDSSTIWLRPDQARSFRESWPAEFDIIRENQTGRAEGGVGRVIVAAGIYLTKAGGLAWYSGDFMRTTRSYIPVGTRRESMVAEALVRQHRAFIRPLGRSDAHGLHHSFTLIDTWPHTDLRVADHRSPRQHQATSHGPGRSAGEWIWSEEGQAMPPFPMPSKAVNDLVPKT